jgi:hypothetical protein
MNYIPINQELVDKINDLLPENECIKERTRLHKIARSGELQATPLQAEVILQIMGKNAIALYDWETHFREIESELDKAKIENYNLTHPRYSDTAPKAVFFLMAFVIALLLFASAQQVWRPSIELAATKKHYNEKTANEIKNLKRSLDSYQTNIIRCDDFIKEIIKPQYQDDIKKITYMKEMWKTRCLECEAKLEE